MIGERECEQCIEIYGESRDYGGSHWHCGNCGEVSSFQGHYGLLPDDEWGFKCQARVAELVEVPEGPGLGWLGRVLAG